MAGGNGRRSGERVLGSGHLVGLFLAVVVLCCVFYTLGYVMGRSQEATVRAAVVDDTATTPAPATLPTRVTPANLPPSANPQTSAADTSSGGEWDFNARNNSASSSSETLPGENSVASRPDAGVTSSSVRSTPGSASPSISASARPALSAPAVQPSTTPSAMKHAAPAVVPAPPASADRFSPPLISHGSFILQVAALKSESDALAMAGALQNKNFPAFVVMPGADKFYRVQVGPYADPQSAKSARTALDHAGFKSIFKH